MKIAIDQSLLPRRLGQPVDAASVSVGAAVRLLRRGYGATQAELAKAVGRERTSITNIEAGKQLLSVDLLCAIADAVGAEVEISFCKPKPQAEGG